MTLANWMAWWRSRRNPFRNRYKHPLFWVKSFFFLACELLHHPTLFFFHRVHHPKVGWAISQDHFVLWAQDEFAPHMASITTLPTLLDHSSYCHKRSGSMYVLLQRIQWSKGHHVDHWQHRACWYLLHERFTCVYLAMHANRESQTRMLSLSSHKKRKSDR